jgi:DUF971 family protein
MGDAPWPLELILHEGRGCVEIAYDDGVRFEIAGPLLRAMSPSASDRGHQGGADHPIARDFTGVRVAAIDPVGAYAVRLRFTDGHDTGLFTWSALRRIGRDQKALEAEHARSLLG